VRAASAIAPSPGLALLAAACGSPGSHVAQLGTATTTLPSGRQERFAAYVAHELRTPMATQRALLELALADASLDVSTWREIGQDVLRACDQQERLLEACLTLARSKDGPRRWESVDLAAIAAEALRAHDLGELESVVASEPAWTIGDPVLLECLVGNLVSNAIRHNVLGGRIEVATCTRSGCAQLTVANTGPQIPVGEVQRLFQPFHRLPRQPTDTADGVGLGLAVVRAIADAHDAVITAQARPSGGLRVDVRLAGRSPCRL
jgi:signal transduction histidine kinase